MANTPTVHTYSVGPRDLTDQYGRPEISVLASPALVGMIERACIAVLDPQLEADDLSVGRSLEFQHLRPSRLGNTIEIHVQLEPAASTKPGKPVRKRSFVVEAYDTGELVGAATHTRSIVNKELFSDK